MTRRTYTFRRTPAWVLAGLLLLAFFVGRGESTPALEPSAPATAPTVTTSRALALLARLSVKGRAPKTGYQRSLYGEPWVDVDHNGCRTRDDVLTRDLTQRQYRDRCVVVAGTLLDPYTHQVHEFRKASAAAIQIDHVVSLSDAWQKGAQQWTPEKRLAFANDPLELMAVSRDVNQAKSDADAASWLPPYKPFRCAFVARQVQVKATYGLWVTGAERDAIRRVLAGCPADRSLPR
ncbi:MAG: HNH endonuclease family protein [Actinomycetota bacterium]|nr:HNH endonuclease family protein [Actinomycetota bacterium]